MRKVSAVICVLVASLILAVIILAQSMFSHLRDSGLFVQTAKEADLYGMAVGQLTKQLMRETKQSGLLLANERDARNLIMRMIPAPLFESQLKAVLDPALGWFNSDLPSSDLVLKISLKELKQNLGTAIPGMPDELSVLEIIPLDSRQDFLSRGEQARNYYHLAQFLRTIMLGLLIVLGICILLLTMTSMRSVLRFIGSVLIFGSALAGLVVLGLPKVVSLAIARQAPDQTESLIRAAEFFVSNLFSSARTMSTVIFTGGIALVIFAQFIFRKTTRT